MVTFLEKKLIGRVNPSDPESSGRHRKMMRKISARARVIMVKYGPLAEKQMRPKGKLIRPTRSAAMTRENAAGIPS
jgi:hypothetical protein